jgi:hypothetical protein
MAAVAASAAASYYDAALAAAEHRETTDQKVALKAMITELLGYSCKIACQAAPEGVVEIYVLSDRLGKVSDYLEIQPSGAIGVMFDLYDDPESDEVGDLSDRCDAYNEGLGLEFVEHDSESESEDGDGESSE